VKKHYKRTDFREPFSAVKEIQVMFADALGGKKKKPSPSRTRTTNTSINRMQVNNTRNQMSNTFQTIGYRTPGPMSKIHFGDRGSTNTSYHNKRNSMDD